MTVTTKCARAAVFAAVAILLAALILRGARTPRRVPLAPVAPRSPGPSIPSYRRLLSLSDAVDEIVFSPSGDRMAVVMAFDDDYGMRLQLWNTRSWTPLPAQKAAAQFDAIGFSPDGSMLASVDGDSLAIRDPLNGRLRRSIHLRKGRIDSLAFSPNGDRIAIGYDDGGVEVLRTPSMRVERSFGNASDCQARSVVCFSPDGGRLAMCRTDGFRIYNTATWAVQREVKMGAWVAQMAFISNTQLAVKDDLPEHDWVTIYDLDDGRAGKRLKSTAGVKSLAVSRDDKMVGIGGIASTAQLWDAATGHLIRALDTSFTKGESPYAGVDALAFGPNGRILVTGVPDGIEIWNIAALRRRVPRKPLAKPLVTLRDAVAPTFAPGRHLLATIGDGRIDLWDTRTWRRVRSLRSDTSLDDGSTLAISKDGRLLACGGDGFLELWDVKSGHPKFRKAVPFGIVGNASFSPDGRTLAAYDHKESITVWSTANGQRLRTFETTVFYDIAYSPDGRRLAIADDATGFTIRNTRNWRRAHGFHTAPRDTVEQLLFSPDGRFLAAGVEGDSQDSIIIWNAHSGRRLRRLDGQILIAVNGFSRDGRSLMTTGPDKGIDTWNTNTWRLERSASDPRPINAAAISPDGALFAGTGDDSIDYLVTIWKRQPPSPR